MASTRRNARAKATESPDDQVSNESVFEKVHNGNEIYYGCTRCLCTSKRRFNIVRHYKRFHFLTKVRKCCGAIFHTKAEYYEHSLNIHFNTRCYSVMFESNSQVNSKRRSKRKRCLKKSTTKTEMDFEHEFCDNQTDYSEESVNTSKEISSTSIKIESLKFEDIPLINFVRNPDIIKDVLRGDKHMKRTSPDIDTNEEMEENFTNFVIPRTQSPILLPLKKRILREIVMCAETRAENKHLNRKSLAEINKRNDNNTAKKSNPVICHANKENNINSNAEINITIDMSISSRILTQQQRMFLSLIDFNKI